MVPSDASLAILFANGSASQTFPSAPRAVADGFPDIGFGTEGELVLDERAERVGGARRRDAATGRDRAAQRRRGDQCQCQQSSNHVPSPDVNHAP